jgi:hypothetical protein
MAKFTTHLQTATILSGIAAVYANEAHGFSFLHSLEFFIAGTIGGILPDIDHFKSKPSKFIRFVISNFIAFLFVFKFASFHQILNLVLIWLGIYFSIQSLFFLLKNKIKHRGAIHSVPFGILISLLVAFFSYKIFNQSVLVSYVLGFFLFLGYISHLILDEIYSVDINGRKIKKSFGSAFKICLNNNALNFILYSIIFILFIFLPKKEEFLHFIKGFFNV